MFDMAEKKARRVDGAANDVDEFLETLEHPFKAEILAIRRIFLGADPRIDEGIKWNAPSFRTTEYFATFHLRAKGCVQLILHRGAKKRAETLAPREIEDPESLLEWLGDDRATIKLEDMAEVEKNRSALADVIRRWLEHV